MTHECSCYREVPAVLDWFPPPVRAVQAVGDIAQHRDGALETMEDMILKRRQPANPPFEEPTSAFVLGQTV